jgi:hypothetical protein
MRPAGLVLSACDSGSEGRLIGKLLGYTFKDKRPLPWSEISKVCLGGWGIDNSVGQMCNLLTA